MSPPRASSHSRFVLPALCLTVLVYYRAIGTFFAQDDITFLSRAAGLAPENLQFRPLSEGLAFRLQYVSFGLNPLPYHLVNLVLHLFNVAGVYVLGYRLMRSQAAAAAAAVLFGCSSIAFTPLHWATGIVELLTGALLITATLLHLASHRRGWVWCWAAALVGLMAMLSKEIAVTWLLVVVLLEWRRERGERSLRFVLPAMTGTALFLVCFFATGQVQRFATSEAYARTLSPPFLARNLATYLQWSLAVWQPIRDAVAAADATAWHIALPFTAGLTAYLLLWRRNLSDAVMIGGGWWIAFLVPVITLRHHTYLYYLYIPSIGGALLASDIGRSLLRHTPHRRAVVLASSLLAVFVLLEARNVRTREIATQDYLPVDRTMRDAMLLSNALPAIRAAQLPRGSGILFVSPLTRRRFDLTTGAATRSEDLAHREAYFPLEAAMRGGSTLDLFVPGVRYLGFATTIPPHLETAESFHFEQRGYLEHWGHGQSALLRQASVQLAAQDWPAAESTLVRVRAYADTLPVVLRDQVAALAGMGRTEDAGVVAREFLARWPNHPLAGEVKKSMDASH